MTLPSSIAAFTTSDASLLRVRLRQIAKIRITRAPSPHEGPLGLFGTDGCFYIPNSIIHAIASLPRVAIICNHDLFNNQSTKPFDPRSNIPLLSTAFS